LVYVVTQIASAVDPILAGFDSWGRLVNDGRLRAAEPDPRQLMAEPGGPHFFDLDAATSETEPTTYESIRAALLCHHPIPEELLADILGVAGCIADD
jgi:hypothetical protein